MESVQETPQRLAQSPVPALTAARVPTQLQGIIIILI